MANIPDIKVVYDSMDELITVPDVAKQEGYKLMKEKKP